MKAQINEQNFVRLRKEDQFMLRLPPGLRDQVREVAERNMRSMNSEIVLALKEKMDRQRETQKADATAS